jgi:hypothetical protein
MHGASSSASTRRAASKARRQPSQPRPMSKPLLQHLCLLQTDLLGPWHGLG